MRDLAAVRLAACALLACTAMRAAASEESQALSARGLVELNAGHLREALDLFDRAVAADPNDADVRYQRGSTRAKLGDYSGAVDDLRLALAARPNFAPAALELGVALTESGQYSEAQRWLMQAQQQPDLDAQASFYLGLAQLRLDQFGAAQENFARARARDPSLETATQYYDGVIAYRRRDLSTAEARFTAVQRANPDSAMARESVQFLALIQRQQRAAYSAFGRVALEYDTNVTLGPNTTIPGAITGQGDWRAVLNAGGRYVPWTRGPVSLALSYEFFQSLQFHLTDFDLQDHRPAVQLMFDFDRFFVGLLSRYDYYLLKTDSFLQEVTAFPWIAMREEGIGRTELYYRMQWRDYYKVSINDVTPPPPKGFKLLNGYYNFVGVRQIVDLGGLNRELWFGYQLGFTDPTGGNVNRADIADTDPDVYQYGSQQFEVALRWPLPYMIVGEAGYRYEYQGYNSASAFQNPTGAVRHDNDHRAVVSFERPLSEIDEHLFVNATWFGTFNDSNNVLFNYDRQIGSIGVEARF